MPDDDCPYCAFTTSRPHVLFDHLERQHLLELETAALDGVRSTEPVNV